MKPKDTKQDDNLKAPKSVRILALLVAVIISVTVFLLRDQLLALQNYGYAGIFLISVLGNATIVLPMPVILVTFLGGGLFNPLIVGVISGVGSTIGELTGYLAGFGGTIAIQKQNKFNNITKKMRKHGFLTLFVLSLIPNPFFDLAGIAAGLMHYPLPKFLAATALGKTIRYVVISFLGAGSVGLLDNLF